MTKVKLYKTNKAKRSVRVRSKLRGTSDRPRLAVFRSNKYIYAQLIDDVKGATVATVSDASIKAKGTKSEKAQAAGKALAEASLKLGIKEVIFDRRGYRYHGRVKSIANGAREGGLKF